MALRSLAAFLAAGLVVAALDGRPRRSGDGVEYSLTLEACAAHGSPAIALADVERLADLARTERQVGWTPEHLARFATELRAQGDGFDGVFRARDGSYYGFHFWLYPLLAVPAKLVLGWTGGNELKAFALTNALVASGVLAYLLVGSSLAPWRRLLAAALFLGCGTLYYLRWTHPEVLVASAFFVGVVAACERRHLLSTAALAVGATQMAPLALVLPLVALLAWRRAGLRRPVGGDRRRLAAYAWWWTVAALPYLLYGLLYGTPQPIAARGFVDLGLIDATRAQSYLLDWQLGMVAGLPALALAAAIAAPLGFWRWRRRHDRGERAPRAEIALAVAAALAFALPMLAAKNWHASVAGFGRYAFIGAMPLVALAAARLDRRLLALAALGQLAVTAAHGGWTVRELPGEFSGAARWVLAHRPSWYDPEPEIFVERLIQRESCCGEVPLERALAFRRDDGVLTKIAFTAEGASRLSADLCGAHGRLLDRRDGRPVAQPTPQGRSRNFLYLSGEFVCAAGVAPIAPSN